MNAYIYILYIHISIHTYTINIVCSTRGPCTPATRLYYTMTIQYHIILY